MVGEPEPIKTEKSTCRMIVISADSFGDDTLIGTIEAGSLVTHVITECRANGTGSGTYSVGIAATNFIENVRKTTADPISGDDPAEYKDGVMYIKGVQVTNTPGNWTLNSLPTLGGSQSTVPTHGGVALTGTWTAGTYTRVNGLGIAVDPGTHQGLIGGATEGTDAAIGGVGLDTGWAVGSASSIVQGTLSGNQTKTASNWVVSVWSRPKGYWIAYDTPAYIYVSGTATATIRARIFYIASGRAV